jgi:hypothetical protein
MKDEARMCAGGRKRERERERESERAARAVLSSSSSSSLFTLASFANEK